MRSRVRRWKPRPFARALAARNRQLTHDSLAAPSVRLHAARPRRRMAALAGRLRDRRRRGRRSDGGQRRGAARARRLGRARLHAGARDGHASVPAAGAVPFGWARRQEGPAAAVGVATLLDRLDALASDPHREETREDDLATLELLGKRGLGDDERTRLRALVEVVRKATATRDGKHAHRRGQPPRTRVSPARLVRRMVDDLPRGGSTAGAPSEVGPRGDASGLTKELPCLDSRATRPRTSGERSTTPDGVACSPTATRSPSQSVARHDGSRDPARARRARDRDARTR